MAETDAQHAADGLQVVVAVPSAGAAVDRLAHAIATWHPRWDIRFVWAGDPQLRPSDRDWIGTPPSEYELAVSEPAARPLLAAGRALPDVAAGPVLVLVAGAVAVAGPLDALVPAEREVIVVPRLHDVTLDAGRHPGLAALTHDGMFSASVMSFGAGVRQMAVWLADLVAVPSAPPTGVAVALMADRAAATRCADPAIGVSAWRWDTQAPALIDAPHRSPDQPWLIDSTLGGPPRVSLADAGRQAAMDAVADQFAPLAPLSLPGGTPIDTPVRTVFREHAAPDLCPWSDPGSGRALVDRHYWATIRRLERDLEIAFPSPTGADADAFARWARGAVGEGRAPLLADPATLRSSEPIRRVADRTDGVNVVGYFGFQSGIGEIARRIADVLRRHGVPHTTVGYDRSEGPRIEPAPALDDRLEFANSIVVVNRDQVPVLRHDMPDAFGPGRRVFGVWFWELDTLPPGRAGIEVDEIWSASTFMADAFRTLGSPEVVVMPLPFAPPEPSGAGRPELGPLATAGDRFVFGVVLDHLSITARKNPIGAIDAFRRAFAPDEGPLLVVKTINARRCWREHERVRAAAAGRPDIVVWDEQLPRADHAAFIAHCDALVSLHRSEGLGLHLAEAMAMGVPVIATRYSGNLDFMDDDSALLVDASIVPVGTDGAWAYPATSRWADPDLDQAAAAMRSLVDDPAVARRVGEAGRERIARWPSEDDFVARVRARAGLDSPSNAPR